MMGYTATGWRCFCLLALLLSMPGCGGETVCDKATKHIEECGATNLKPKESECGESGQCSAQCILDAPCEDLRTGTQWAQCAARC